MLEKYFPVFALAENQWAATFFLQEVARRDKKKNIDETGGEGEDGDEGGAEAGIRSLMMGGGFDGSEVGAVGEGPESQEVSASATGAFANSPQYNQPRARTSPSSRRR